MSISFKTWKSIEVDYSKNINHYYNECKKLSIISPGIFENILNKISFKPESKVISVKLVKIELDQISKYGITLASTNEEMMNHFYQLGLRKCDIQTGLELRCSYRQKVEKKIMRIITEPIILNNGKLQLILVKAAKKHYLNIMDVRENLYNIFVPTSLVFRK